jgi:RNA recognition motif-containing protein
MSKRLFVGSIPYSSTDEDLRTHFAGAGNVVDAKVIMDKMTGRSRGFGFVEFETDDEARKAIEMFHDQEMDGRRLTVNEAREMAPRDNGAA